MIVYANLIRRFFKETKPIVLGGIEASLRRIAHYDCLVEPGPPLHPDRRQGRSARLRHGGKTVLELAERLREGTLRIGPAGPLLRRRGDQKPGTLELPSYEEAAADPAAFAEMFLAFIGIRIP